MAESRGIQSIEVGHRLLRVLCEAPGSLALKDLASRAAMSATKAHYYLTSFVRLGLVEQSAPGARYELGPEAVRLGLAAITRLDIFGIAREAMYDVRDATGAAVFLSVWGDRGPTIIHRVEGLHLTPLSIRVGSVLDPLSATGRAILSTFPDATLREMLKEAIARAVPGEAAFGADTDDAMKLVADVRRDGVARGRGTVATESGFVGLAAPINTFDNSMPAALTINGHASSFDMSPTSVNVTVLAAATRAIAERTGVPINLEKGRSSHAKPAGPDPNASGGRP